jgi:hypothetical protein
MNRLITLSTLLVLASVAHTAFAKNATVYADGVLIEFEVSATRGVADVPLPPGMIPGSLRIKPDGAAAIQRVDFIQTSADSGKGGKELESLFEQKSRLNDRLQALATREEIFKSAAKSQSGKAPRKSKTNPDPLQTIRQGTEFAIAQLEAVYTARRKTEAEIRRLDNRIAAAKNSTHGSESLARILVSQPRGKVRVRYALGGQGWSPRYDVYLNNSGKARVHLSGEFPGTFAGYLLQASTAGLAQSTTARVFPVQPGPVSRLAEYTLPVTEEQFGAGVVPSFSFQLKNLETVHLPAGDASVYQNGEYVGRVRFEGLSSGRSRRISGGN